MLNYGLNAEMALLFYKNTVVNLSDTIIIIKLWQVLVWFHNIFVQYIFLTKQEYIS